MMVAHGHVEIVMKMLKNGDTWTCRDGNENAEN